MFSGYVLAGTGLALIGAVAFVSVMLPIWTTEIGVTTQRFIYKRGLIWRSSQELQLRSIEEVNLDQGLLGRLFNFGRIALHGTGVGDIKLPSLADPVGLQRAIQESIAVATQAAAAPSAPAAVQAQPPPIFRGGALMAFEDVQAELGLLLTQMQNEKRPEDRHEAYLVILRKLNELKAYGMPLPQDLLDLEAALEAEFEAEVGGGRTEPEQPAS